MRELLAAAAAARGDATALVEGVSTWTYAELERDARGLAGALAAAGVAAGARVVTLLPTSAAHVLALHAVWRAGACMVPLTPSAGAEAVGAAAARAKADVAVVDAASAAVAQEAGLRTVAAAAREPPAPPVVAGGPDDVVALVHTSGTGGSPRAVRLLARNLAASAAASAARLGTGPRDRWLLALPLAHVGGLSIPVRAAHDGGAVVVATGDVATHLDAGDATVVSLVPTQLSRLVDARAGRPFAARPRVLLGGAPAPSDLVAQARALGLDVRRTYGLTEAASQVATETAEGRMLPLPGIEVRVGPDGALEVRGPTVADGYEGDDAATRATFVDGWLRTRDLGEVVADGSVRVLGRIDAVIVTGGEKVSPETVEAALLAHPAVTEACVVGVPDREWGERVVAAVVLRAAASADDLRAFVRARLPPHAVPKEVRAVAALPRTSAGKVSRAAVREALAGSAP